MLEPSTRSHTQITPRPFLLFGWVLLLVVYLTWSCQGPSVPDEPTTETTSSSEGSSKETLQEKASGPEASTEKQDSSEPGPEAGPEAEPEQPSPGPEPGPEPTVEPPPPDENGPFACPTVKPTAPPAALKLDPFYKKYVDAGGLPLVGSDKVPDTAFAQAYYVIANMLRGKPCIRKALQNSGVLFGIMAESEVTTNMPEYSDLNKAFPNVDWDKRGRGFGATLVRPLTTGAVENLLQKRADPWFGELIFLHEFAHTFFEFGIESLEGGAKHRSTLQSLYSDARSAGKWDKTYAATNANEYWAETVQSWFNNNLSADPPNGIHNNIDTRTELESYDPKMAQYIAQFFDPQPWPAYCDTSGNGRVWKDPTPSGNSGETCKLHRFFMKDKGCKDLDKRKSQNGGNNQSIVFVNRSLTKTYKLDWIDFQGVRKNYGTVAPRRSRTLSTFNAHEWVMTDDQGNCIASYTTSHPVNVISLP